MKWLISTIFDFWFIYLLLSKRWKTFFFVWKNVDCTNSICLQMGVWTIHICRSKKKHNKKRNNPLKIKWEIKFKAYFIFIHMIYGKINFLHRCTEWICSKLQRIYNIHRQFNDNSTATIIFTETIFFSFNRVQFIFCCYRMKRNEKKKTLYV